MTGKFSTRGYPPDSGRDDVSMTSSTASTPRRYDVSSDNGDMLIYGRRNLSDSEVHLATRNVKVSEVNVHQTERSSRSVLFI